MWNMLKLNNKDNKTASWRHYVVFIFNSDHISQLFSTVPIVEFEQVTVYCIFLIIFVEYETLKSSRRLLD